jgi:beta-propeller uncharacterized protein DUF5122
MWRGQRAGVAKPAATLALAVALVFALASPAGAAALGSTPVAFPVTDGTVSAEQIVGDTLYIGGSFSHVASPTGPAAQFAAADGSLAGLPALSGVGATVTAATADGAGGWYVAGTFSRAGALPAAGLVHILADGTVDRGFAPPPIQATAGTGAILALALEGSTLYVGGDFSSTGQISRHSLVALDASTGAADSSFTTDTDGTVDVLLASAVTLYVGGEFTHVAGLPANSVAAVDLAGGQPVPGFLAPSGVGPVHHLSLVGSMLYASGGYDANAAPYDSAIALDATDGHQLKAFAPTVVIDGAMTATPTAVYVVTPMTDQLIATDRGVVALDPTTGARLPGFAAKSDGTIDALQVLDASLYVGGTFAELSGAPRRNLAAVDLATGAARPATFDTNGPVATIAPAAGALLAGGGFQSVGGAARRNLAAIDIATGAVVPGFDPEPNGPVKALDYDGGALYVGGAFRQIAGGARSSLAALDPTRGALLGFDPELASELDQLPTVAALAGDGSHLFVTGAFDHVGQAARENLAAIDESDGVATPFIADLSGLGEALLLDGDRLYVVVAWGLLDGRYADGVAALDAASGALDADFTAEVDGGEVLSIARAGDTLYLGGRFDAVNQVARSDLAAVDAATGAVQPFSADVDGAVTSLAVDRGMLEVGGYFDEVAGVQRYGLAELTADGTPTGFDPQLAAYVEASAVGPDGSLFTGGEIAAAGRAPVDGLAEFSPTAAVAAANLTPPSLSGTPAAGQTLTCEPGSWAPAVDRLRYSWQSDGDVDAAGAGPTLTLTDADDGHAIACQVTGESPGGSVAATSVALVVPGPVPDLDTAPDLLPGTQPGVIEAPVGPLAVGHFVYPGAADWQPAPSSFDYQWQRCSAAGDSCQQIAGATDRGYRLSAADIGSSLRVVVTAADAAGSSTPVASQPTAPLPAGLPQDTTPPAAPAGPSDGDPGNWTESPTDYDYDSERCLPDGGPCQPIPRATSEGYPDAGNVGYQLVVGVAALNGYGLSTPVESARSPVVSAVAGAPPAPRSTATPTIQGSAAVGAVLSTTGGAWDEELGGEEIQWERCAPDGSACVEIVDADAPDYFATAADAGRTLRVRVVAVGSGGPSAPLVSAALGPLGPLQPSGQSPPGAPSPVDSPSPAPPAVQTPGTAPIPMPTPAAATPSGPAPAPVSARRSPTRLLLALSLRAGSPVRLNSIDLRVRCSATATVQVTLTLSAAAARAAGLHPARAVHTLASARAACGPTARALAVRVASRLLARLHGHPAVLLTARAHAGARLSAPVTIRLP